MNSNYSEIETDKELYMAGEDYKELVEVLNRIEKQLEEIKFDIVDIKNAMPKVPYYGDLLQDIVKAVEENRR
jgi:hypothetical protein